jgi:hypothetical protein
MKERGAAALFVLRCARVTKIGGTVDGQEETESKKS